ncbi:MAG: glycoside hydrolase family 57 protein [Thermoplasmatota archaeon]
MTSVCFYFQVHQPIRLRRMHIFEMPERFDYWDHAKNKEIFDRVADKCYLPTNAALLELIAKHDGRFKVAFSLSGTFVEQARAFRPEVLDSFRALVDTGCVEILDETYYHSLAGLWEDQTEYKAQIAEHRELVKKEFGVEPAMFRNTELIYDDRIARTIESLGYRGIVTEGTEKILDWRSPNYVYRPSGEGRRLKVLLKNYRLSDDVAFRFGNGSWPEYPLTAEKYADWLARCEGPTVNLFMDYETFGEHNWRESGIFEFLDHLPGHVLAKPNLSFATPSEVAAANESVGTLDVPFAISWADTERDVSAWLHNEMQHQCFNDLRAMKDVVVQAADPELMHAWRLLQTSDHLYYCTTKFFGDQDIHTYFSPYDSPYQAFINYTNAIRDLAEKAKRAVRR